MLNRKCKRQRKREIEIVLTIAAERQLFLIETFSVAEGNHATFSSLLLSMSYLGIARTGQMEIGSTGRVLRLEDVREAMVAGHWMTKGEIWERTCSIAILSTALYSMALVPLRGILRELFKRDEVELCPHPLVRSYDQLIGGEAAFDSSEITYRKRRR